MASPIDPATKSSPPVTGESPFAPRQPGIPLAALFLLIAIIAVLLGMMGVALRSFDFRNEAWTERLAAGIGSATLFGILGGIRGMFSFHRDRDVPIGMIAGALIGLIGAGVMFTHPDDQRELLLIALVGSAVIVALAAAMRWQAARA